MDLLIDLLVLLIKAATKSRAPAVPLPRPQEAAAAQQQIQQMQRTLAAQQARTRPAPRQAGRGPASWAQPDVRAAVPPVNQPPVPAIRSDSDFIGRPQPPPRGIPGLKIPFLLGEVLSSPVAFREDFHGGLDM